MVRTLHAVGISLLLADLSAVHVLALDAEEFERAVRAGRSVESISKAPPFLKVGTKFPKGSFARSVFLNQSDPPFVFGIRGCRQYVAHESARAALDNRDPDIEALKRECLDRDAIRVFVISPQGEAALASASLGYIPRPARPVTAVALRLDGELVQPIPDTGFDLDGDGRSGETGRFDHQAVKQAKSISIVATIESSYRLELRVPAQILKQIR